MALKLGTKGYLYSKWRGIFEVKEGYVLPTNYNNWSGRFIVKNGHKEKHLQCTLEPGVVYNGSVWLTERDDALARKLLIEKEDASIKELEQKIEYHKFAIQLLMEEPRNAK